MGFLYMKQLPVETVQLNLDRTFQGLLVTHLFELLIGGELDGGVRNNSYTIDAVSSHKPSEALFLPHAN